MNSHTKPHQPIIDIPVIGSITAGLPLDKAEGIQSSISVAAEGMTAPQKYSALAVIGDGLADDGIRDGDTIIIQKQTKARDGQIVVALIDGNKATVKKIYKEPTHIRLESLTASTPPEYHEHVTIFGIVIKHISKLKAPSLSTRANSNSKTHSFRTIDLFAGIGGIRLGFEKAGFKTVFANDFDAQCKITYDKNFTDSPLAVDDIKKIDIATLPEFDFVLGGFPCQSFSIAGHRQGFHDKKGRGELFFDIAKIIKERNPQGFLLENVKNLKTHDKGNTFRVIKEQLEQLGYHIHAKVLNSMDYGNIPQNRERIYIVGFKNEAYYNNFTFPKAVPLTVSVTDLLDTHVPEKYYYNGKPLFERIEKAITDRSKVYQWRRQYVRENKKGVCPTLTANMGMGGHNVPIILDAKGIRKLTPKECSRIQGFPESFILPPLADSALYKQIGNSVSVPVIAAVARQMMHAIEASA